MIVKKSEKVRKQPLIPIEEYIKYTEEPMKNGEEPMKKGEEPVKKAEERMKEGEERMKDSEERMKNGEERITRGEGLVNDRRRIISNCCCMSIGHQKVAKIRKEFRNNQSIN